MKRFALCVLTVMLLCGCAQSREDPFRVDTVVQIPVDPTDAPTEGATEVLAEEPTEMPTEMPVEPTETTPKKTTTSYKSSGSGSSGREPSSEKTPSTSNKKPKETEPSMEESIPPATRPPFDPFTYSVGELEQAIAAALNTERSLAGVPELTVDVRLSGIAYLRAEEAGIAWGHTRPDGRDYTTILSDYGLSHGAVTELMAYVPGAGDSAVVTGKWMGVKSFSESILSGVYSRAGIGIYTEEGMTYVVCLLVE